MSRQNHEIKNYYKEWGAPDIGEQYYNKDFFMPQHPTNFAIIGATGYGKTNILMNIIAKSDCFTDIFLFTGSTPKEFLYDKLKEKLGDKFTAFESLNDFITFKEELKEVGNRQILVIIDDFIMQKKFHDIMTHFLTYARKANTGGTSVCMLTQEFHQIPKTARLQCKYFFLMGGFDKKELRGITGRFACADCTLENIEYMYNESTRNKDITDFFMIDKKTKFDNLKFRKGFYDNWTINQAERFQFNGLAEEQELESIETKKLRMKQLAQEEENEDDVDDDYEEVLVLHTSKGKAGASAPPKLEKRRK